MEKLETIRKGQIWLTVFKTEDEDLIVTMQRTYRDRDGRLKFTPFLNASRGDIRDVNDCLSRFHEFEREYYYGGEGQ
jgi:hypothetical protein